MEKVLNFSFFQLFHCIHIFFQSNKEAYNFFSALNLIFSVEAVPVEKWRETEIVSPRHGRSLLYCKDKGNAAISTFSRSVFVINLEKLFRLSMAGFDKEGRNGV